MIYLLVGYGDITVKEKKNDFVVDFYQIERQLDDLNFESLGTSN